MVVNYSYLYYHSSEDGRHLNQQFGPQSRPVELFSINKSSDPLPGNWSYDSAIGVFSLNPADSDPVYFDFGDKRADSMNPGGIRIAEDTGSLSLDPHSDDQSWSMSIHPWIDMAITSPTSTAPSTCTSTNSFINDYTNTLVSPSMSSLRSSYSPEIKPKTYIPTRTKKHRKTRALSNESSTLSTPTRGRGSTSTQISTLEGPQGRNAAKRAAHNIIEKRYRTNMNAKFLALEKLISPAGTHNPSTGSAGTSAGSLKKSQILSNALTYIEHIQQENLAVQKELALLKQGVNFGGMWKTIKAGRS